MGFAGDVKIDYEPCHRIKAAGRIDITYYTDKLRIENLKNLNKIYSEIVEGFRGQKSAVCLKGFTRNITDDVLHVLCYFTAYYESKTDEPIISKIEGGNYGTDQEI